MASVSIGNDSVVIINGTGSDVSVGNASDVSLSRTEIISRGMELDLYTAGRLLFLIASPTMSVAGLVGNVLTAMVMLQKHNRKSSSCVYMAMLGVTDMASNMVYLLWNSIGKGLMAYAYTPTNHKGVCMAFWYLGSSTVLSSTFVLTAMTIDRFVAIRWPMRALELCTARRAKWMCGVAIVLGFVCKLPYIWLTKPVGESDCLPFGNTENELIRVYYWINTSLGCYIPFLSLLTLNILIIRALGVKQRQKYIQEGGISRGQQQSVHVTCTSGRLTADVNCSDHSTSREAEKATINFKSSKGKGVSQRTNSSVTVMLLLVSFAFVILVAPLYLFYVVYMIKSNTSSPMAFAVYYFTSQVTLALFQLNSAINFYLYCISGTKFRKDLKLLLESMKCCQKGADTTLPRTRSRKTTNSQLCE